MKRKDPSSVISSNSSNSNSGNRRTGLYFSRATGSLVLILVAMLRRHLAAVPRGSTHTGAPGLSSWYRPSASLSTRDRPSSCFHPWIILPSAASATPVVSFQGHSRRLFHSRAASDRAQSLASGHSPFTTCLLFSRSFHSSETSLWNHNSTKDDNHRSRINSTTTQESNPPPKHEENATHTNELLLKKGFSSPYSRRFRQGLGGVFSAAGFLSSSMLSILSNPQRFWAQTQQPLRAFRNFLKTSGIDVELDQALSWKNNRQLAIQLAILARVQQAQQKNGDARRDGTVAANTTPISSEFWTRARRYMRYATAVYGRHMIRAVQVDARGQRFNALAKSVGQETLQAISEHVQVPTDDLILVHVDQDYEGEDQDQGHHHHTLRHLVAIDHAHKEVVLALRGTFSLQEVVIDIASFSRENYCGGEAHEGMANMAERVWEVAGGTVVSLLEQHPNYTFIVTGHSLGGGTASLLTILLKQQQLQQTRPFTERTVGTEDNYPPRLPPSTELQCFAYASPPVFTPLEVIPQARQLITNFIHDTDAVPFLSVYSVRQLLAQLKALQPHVKNLTWGEKLSIATGSQPPATALVDTVAVVTPKRGAPRLEVPAAQTIWLRPSSKKEDQDHHDYRASVWKRLPSTISIHSNMLLDHFPPRYEYALDHVVVVEEQENETK